MARLERHQKGDKPHQELVYAMCHVPAITLESRDGNSRNSVSRSGFGHLRRPILEHPLVVPFTKLTPTALVGIPPSISQIFRSDWIGLD